MDKTCTCHAAGRHRVCCHLLAALPHEDGEELLEAAFISSAALPVARRRRQRLPPSAEEPLDIAAAELAVLQPLERGSTLAGQHALVGSLCNSLKRKAAVLREGQQAQLIARLEGLLEEVTAAAPAFALTTMAEKKKGTKKANRQPGDRVHKQLQQRFTAVTSGKPRTVERGAGELKRVQTRGGKRPSRQSGVQ